MRKILLSLIIGVVSIHTYASKITELNRSIIFDFFFNYELNEASGNNRILFPYCPNSKLSKDKYKYSLLT